ncbi:MAG: sulfite exporter TauE/SafE family protein [Bacteroidota bacterium]
MEIIFLAIVFISTIITGAFGFGSAIILIPVSSFFMDIKEAIAILTIYFMSVNINQIILFRKKIDWQLVGYILLGAIPAAIAGASLMVISPSDLLKRLLGIIIILYILNEIFQFLKKYKLKKFMISFVSIFYGFFAGIIGTGSGIKAAILTHMGITKEGFIAIMATTAIFVNTIKTIIYSRSSLVSAEDIPLMAALIAIGFTGSYIGKLLVKKISPVLFRYAILIILLFIGLKLIIFP